MDELQLSETEQRLLNHASRTAVPGRHAARNAVDHLQHAWRIREIDPAMSVFRVITADEESATAVFHGVKLRKYSGAEQLRPYRHDHKAALEPFLVAVEHSLATMGMPEFAPALILSREYERPCISMCFQVRDSNGQPYTITPEPPLHGLYTRDGQPHEFTEELSLLADLHHAKTIRQHIDMLANRRNLLLYATSEGIPGVRDIRVELFDSARRRVFRNLAIYLLIVEYDQRQDLVQQGLSAFLRMLGHMPPSTVENNEGWQPNP
jgi:hypothetical protein